MASRGLERCVDKKEAARERLRRKRDAAALAGAGTSLQSSSQPSTATPGPAPAAAAAAHAHAAAAAGSGAGRGGGKKNPKGKGASQRAEEALTDEQRRALARRQLWEKASEKWKAELLVRCCTIDWDVAEALVASESGLPIDAARLLLEMSAGTSFLQTSNRWTGLFFAAPQPREISSLFSVDLTVGGDRISLDIFLTSAAIWLRPDFVIRCAALPVCKVDGGPIDPTDICGPSMPTCGRCSLLRASVCEMEPWPGEFTDPTPVCDEATGSFSFGIGEGLAGIMARSPLDVLLEQPPLSPSAPDVVADTVRRLYNIGSPDAEEMIASLFEELGGLMKELQLNSGKLATIRRQQRMLTRLLFGLEFYARNPEAKGFRVIRDVQLGKCLDDGPASSRSAWDDLDDDEPVKEGGDEVEELRAHIRRSLWDPERLSGTELRLPCVSALEPSVPFAFVPIAVAAGQSTRAVHIAWIGGRNPDVEKFHSTWQVNCVPDIVDQVVASSLHYPAHSLFDRADTIAVALNDFAERLEAVERSWREGVAKAAGEPMPAASLQLNQILALVLGRVRADIDADVLRMRAEEEARAADPDPTSSSSSARALDSISEEDGARIAYEIARALRPAERTLAREYLRLVRRYCVACLLARRLQQNSLSLRDVLFRGGAAVRALCSAREDAVFWLTAGVKRLLPGRLAAALDEEVERRERAAQALVGELEREESKKEEEKRRKAEEAAKAKAAAAAAAAKRGGGGGGGGGGGKGGRGAAKQGRAAAAAAAARRGGHSSGEEREERALADLEAEVERLREEVGEARGEAKWHEEQKNAEKAALETASAVFLSDGGLSKGSGSKKKHGAEAPLDSLRKEVEARRAALRAQSEATRRAEAAAKAAEAELAAARGGAEEAAAAAERAEAQARQAEEAVLKLQASTASAAASAHHHLGELARLREERAARRAAVEMECAQMDLRARLWQCAPSPPHHLLCLPFLPPFPLPLTGLRFGQGDAGALEGTPDGPLRAMLDHLRLFQAEAEAELAGPASPAGAAPPFPTSATTRADSIPVAPAPFPAPQPPAPAPESLSNGTPPKPASLPPGWVAASPASNFPTLRPASDVPPAPPPPRLPVPVPPFAPSVPEEAPCGIPPQLGSPRRLYPLVPPVLPPEDLSPPGGVLPPAPHLPLPVPVSASGPAVNSAPVPPSSGAPGFGRGRGGGSAPADSNVAAPGFPAPLRPPRLDPQAAAFVPLPPFVPPHPEEEDKGYGVAAGTEAPPVSFETVPPGPWGRAGYSVPPEVGEGGYEEVGAAEGYAEPPEGGAGGEENEAGGAPPPPPPPPPSAPQGGGAAPLAPRPTPPTPPSPPLPLAPLRITANLLNQLRDCCAGREAVGYLAGRDVTDSDGSGGEAVMVTTAIVPPQRPAPGGSHIVVDENALGMALIGRDESAVGCWRLKSISPSPPPPDGPTGTLPPPLTGSARAVCLILSPSDRSRPYVFFQLTPRGLAVVSQCRGDRHQHGPAAELYRQASHFEIIKGGGTANSNPLDLRSQQGYAHTAGRSSVPQGSGARGGRR
eukprot:tig00000334_g24100.t1